MTLAAATWVGPQLFDGAAAKDRLREATRGDSDLRYTVTYLDGGYDLVLPPDATLTAGQKAVLGHWGSGDQLSGLEALTAQLRAAGAADPNVLTVRVTLEGRRNQPVKIDAIEAVNVQRRNPYSGIFLSIPPQGPGNTIKMMLNLDEVRPVVRAAIPVPSGDPPRTTERDGVRPGSPYFADKTLTIDDAEEDALVVQSIAARWATSFDLRITYRLGDQTRSLLVDNDGHPFAVTPLNCIDHSVSDRGQLVSEGHVSYQQVWELKNDFTGAAPVADPHHYPIGFPYC
ncbi:hypothetical protein [Cryptosporangium sp. NPDC051539]|uniref:hypothetical protein n=1 Tax=Cryptosporangium sp. NPDC051539 TaxID=3363962 RepID=UPI0037B9B504